MESISQGHPISEVKGVPLLQGTPTLRTRSSSPSESSCIAQHDWQVRSVSACPAPSHDTIEMVVGSGVTCRRMSCHKNRYAPPLEAILEATIRGGRLSERLTVTAAAGHNAGSGALQSTHRGRHRTPRVLGRLVCRQYWSHIH